MNATPNSSTTNPLATALGNTSSATNTRNTPTQTTSSNDSSQYEPKKGLSLKMVLGSVMLAFVILGSAAGFYLTQYTNLDNRQQAAGIGDTITVEQGHQNTCIETCTTIERAAGTPNASGYCYENAGVYVRHYKCDDVKTGTQPCNENGTTVCEGACTGQTFGFDQNQQCGTQQIDLGCASPRGTYGNVGFISYWGPNACNQPTNPPTQPPTTNPPTNPPTTSTPTPTPPNVEVACTGFTGTLKTGPITNLDAPLSYSITSTGTAVNKVELVMHGDFTPPAMGSGWATIATDPTPADGTFTGTVTYRQMVDALVATGHNRQMLLDKGIVYFANVYGPKGFCTGANVWSGTGEACTRNPQCNGKALLPADVACVDLTGTLKTGRITSLETPLNYTVTSTGSTVNKVELVMHGNFTPPAMGTGWATIATDPTPGDGTFTGSTTYGQMVEALVKTGHDRQQLLDRGIVYFANVYGPKGFCTGANVWSSTGEACTLNPLCNGLAVLTSTATATPTPPPNAPMCQDIAILDEAGNVINSDTNPNPFFVNKIIKFRCAANDPASQVARYEFKITEPNGTVIEGGVINPSGNSAISKNYQVPTSGNFLAQCRVCLKDGSCQGYYGPIR